MQPTVQVYEVPESAAAVTKQIEQGYDFIKVYDYISLPVYEAIIETSHAQGVMVVGHTPTKVGLERVLNSGQVTIEHFSGFIDADAGEYGVPEGELPKYAQMAAAAGVYICPTIAVYQMYVPKEDLYLLEERPEMAYISPGTKFMWKYITRPGSMGNVTYQGDYPARINELFMNTTRILHEHGVKFILGTDTDNPYLVPGTSLLDELTKGPDKGKEDTIMKEVTLLGKDPQHDIPAEGWFVSSSHAKIFRRGDRFYISHLGGFLSSTKVNGIGIKEDHILKNKDQVDIGNSTYVFTQPPAEHD